MTSAATPDAVSPSPNANNTFMGLMSHLQTMELQLTSVLMEATMKIAAMIDANVFIMVESSGQRYFSGRKYLIESYLSNCLGPSSNDVELEIYPEVCALQEKSGSHHPGSGSTPNHHHQHHHSPHGPPSSNYSTSSPGHHQHHHHSHHHHGGQHNHRHNVQHHHQHHDPHSQDQHSQQHHRSQQQQQHPPHGDASRRSRKRSSPASSSASSHFGEYSQMRSKSGSSTPKKLRTEIAASLKLEEESGGGGRGDGGGSGGGAETDDIAVIDEEGADGDQYGDGNGESYQIENGDVPTNEHMTVLSAILAHPKLEAVQQVVDSSVSDKDSVASKLLNSLLYEYAKIAAHHCPFDTVDDPRCKAFYSRCFEELWSHLPNLQELHDKGLKTSIGKRARPLKSGCREKYRTVFAHTKKSPYPIKYKSLEWCPNEGAPRSQNVSHHQSDGNGGGSGGAGGSGVAAAAGTGGGGGSIGRDGGGLVMGDVVPRMADVHVGGGPMDDPVMRLGLNLNSH